MALLHCPTISRPLIFEIWEASTLKAGGSSSISKQWTFISKQFREFLKLYPVEQHIDGCNLLTPPQVIPQKRRLRHSVSIRVYLGIKTGVAVLHFLFRYQFC